MASGQQGNPAENLIACRTAVEHARAGKDVRRLCLALTDLGTALFHLRNYEEGVAAFDEARELATGLDDLQFQVQCLAMTASAYQDIRRFHNAYEFITQIVELADAHGDLGMKCDAFITQGQILADSGEPILALDKLKAARDLTNQLDDQRRLMKVYGALGNVKIAAAELVEAQTFFDMALSLAAQLGDKHAECRYSLNIGTVLVWQRLYPQAVPLFERALTLAKELDDREAQLAALRSLAESLHKTEKPERVLPLAQRGLALAHELSQHDSVFFFSNMLIYACYRTNQPDEALRVIQMAVEHARSINDLNQEVNMLLNLGESYMVMSLYEQAVDAYRHALAGTRQLHRLSDEAYLVGRVGVALAELGQTGEAIAHHRQSADLARQRGMPELEGEQLIMLALAYLEQGEVIQARSCCQEAINVYSSVSLPKEADKARRLLDEMPPD